jgi:hypothetical protein
VEARGNFTANKRRKMGNPAGEEVVIEAGTPEEKEEAGEMVVS